MENTKRKNLIKVIPSELWLENNILLDITKKDEEEYDCVVIENGKYYFITKDKSDSHKLHIREFFMYNRAIVAFEDTSLSDEDKEKILEDVRIAKKYLSLTEFDSKDINNYTSYYILDFNEQDYELIKQEKLKEKNTKKHNFTIKSH